MKLELFRSSYFGSKSWVCCFTCIGINISFIGRRINISFIGRNLYIFQGPTVKLKLEMWEIGFTVFLNMYDKITFKN